jgi:phosphatidylserine/phosphatidylglycerophosphate/cardiolipin synthase-like enzyme
MRHSLYVMDDPSAALGAVSGDVELVIGSEHFRKIVREGMLTAKVSLDLMTADFKAMLVPELGKRRAPSIVEVFRRLAGRGVEIRLLHAGTPSSAALRELKRKLPAGLTIRRCPRLHAKAVIVDCRAMYLGSANLTGAGLGAKADGRRNFEMGVWTQSSSLIDGVLEQFNALWEGKCCTTCRRKDVCPVPLEEPDLVPRASMHRRRQRDITR